jgi:hypothetical protein
VRTGWESLQPSQHEVYLTAAAADLPLPLVVWQPIPHDGNTQSTWRLHMPVLPAGLLPKLFVSLHRSLKAVRGTFWSCRSAAFVLIKQTQSVYAVCVQVHRPSLLKISDGDLRHPPREVPHISVMARGVQPGGVACLIADQCRSTIESAFPGLALHVGVVCPQCISACKQTPTIYSINEQSEGRWKGRMSLKDASSRASGVHRPSIWSSVANAATASSAPKQWVPSGRAEADLKALLEINPHSAVSSPTCAHVLTCQQLLHGTGSSHSLPLACVPSFGRPGIPPLPRMVCILPSIVPWWSKPRQWVSDALRLHLLCEFPPRPHFLAGQVPLLSRIIFRE